MTKETIIKNCKRLCDFLGVEDYKKLNIPESVSIKDLFVTYSLILDINGCPSKNHSIIIVESEDDFNEILNWAKGKDRFKLRNMNFLCLNLITFYYMDFYWEVKFYYKNKAPVKRALEVF